MRAVELANDELGGLAEPSVATVQPRRQIHGLPENGLDGQRQALGDAAQRRDVRAAATVLEQADERDRKAGPCREINLQHLAGLPDSTDGASYIHGEKKPGRRFLIRITFAQQPSVRSDDSSHHG